MSTSAKLQVGEAARLLGITPKTIRYYQKIGLLAKGTRQSNGYRLFDSADLIRLQQIKRLQALGMSLDQVKLVLGEPATEHEQSLRSVLQNLLEETQAEITVLEARRSRLQTFLEHDTLDLDQPFETPSIMALVKETFGDAWQGLSPAALAMEERMQTAISSYQWPVDYQSAQLQLINYIRLHPECHQLLFAASAQFAAVAELPPDAPEVDVLIQIFRDLRDQFPDLLKLGDTSMGSVSAAIQQIFTGVLTHSLKPAQRQIFERLVEEMK